MTQIIPASQHAATDKLKGHLAMLLFSVLIAGSFSLGKLAVPFIAPAPLNALRFVLGATIMGVVAFGVRRVPFFVPAKPWRFGILGFLMAVYFVTMFVALTMTAPISTSAVFTLTPILTAIFGYLVLRQVVRPVIALSLVFTGFGSIWVIFRGDVSAILGFDVGPGEMIYFRRLCRARHLCAAAGQVPSRRAHSGGDILHAVGDGAVARSPLDAREILTTDWLHLPMIVWVTLAYLAVFPTAVTFFLIQYASLRLPATQGAGLWLSGAGQRHPDRGLCRPRLGVACRSHSVRLPRASVSWCSILRARPEVRRAFAGPHRREWKR